MRKILKSTIRISGELETWLCKFHKTHGETFRKLQNPYRLAKLNMLWSKAVHRLTEPKLKSLFTELKIHDKEELAFKHQKAEKPKDFNDGMKEAELRKKLIGIMSTYDLLEIIDLDDANEQEGKRQKPYEGKAKSDNYKNKSLFKDKKLNKLWERAELGGFSPEELETLKEEFLHHEEKVQMYYSMLEKLTDVKNNRDEHHKSKLNMFASANRWLQSYFVLDAINEEELEAFNEILAPGDDSNESKQEKTPEDKHQEYEAKANKVRDKHREIRDNADRLERLAARGSNSSDFIEPKVQGLWRIAQAGNFSVDELASIKIELHHFESRFLKLRSMHAEHALAMEKSKSVKHGDKSYDRLDELEGKIQKQSRKVEKIQDELEKRLLKHTEL